MLSQYSSRLSPADHFHPWAIGRYVDASHIIMAIYLNSSKASWFILLQSGQVSMWVNQVDGLYETQIEMKSLGIMSRSIANMENPKQRTAAILPDWDFDRRLYGSPWSVHSDATSHDKRLSIILSALVWRRLAGPERHASSPRAADRDPEHLPRNHGGH